MRVMILNGSPKKKISTSAYIQKTLKVMFGRTEVIERPMHTRSDIPGAMEQLGDIDALIIAAPLYVDGIPSNVLRFLKEAEQVCRQEKYHFKVYAVTNNGFIEGHQSQVNLEQYGCWAERAGLSWGGGIGLGGGTILLWYNVCIPIALMELAIGMISHALGGLPILNAQMLLSAAKTLGWLLFFSSSMLICEAALTARVKRGRAGRNIYGRFVCPAVLFMICADIFMLLLCIIKGGIFKNLWHREAA